jgi:enamine deaminase RidA (YjgF/YER057c/UK114 family)
MVNTLYVHRPRSELGGSVALNFPVPRCMQHRPHARARTAVPPKLGYVASQTHRVLDNIATAPETVGKSLSDVLHVGIVYLTDISDFKVMSQAYSEHFAEPYLARTVIGASALLLGAAVEMDVVVG